MKVATQFFAHRNSAKVLSGLLFGTALQLPAVVAGADPTSPQCTQAETACMNYLTTAGSTECEEDYECDAYFYDCSAGCDQPAILRRPGIAKDRESELRRLVSNVRKSCGVEASAPQRCRPELPITGCVAGRCEILPQGGPEGGLGEEASQPAAPDRQSE